MSAGMSATPTPRNYRYYDFVMAASVTVLLCSNFIGAAKQATVDLLQKQTAPGQTAAIAGHQANLNLLQSQYSATYARSQDLVIEENRLAGSLTMVQAAVAPLKPYDPDPVRYLAAGLAAGLCVALITVLLVDRFDDRLFETDALGLAAGTRLVVAVNSEKSAPDCGATPSPGNGIVFLLFT